MNMKEKEIYTAPECEEIRIRLEGCIAISGQDNEGDLGGYWDDDEG